MASFEELLKKSIQEDVEAVHIPDGDQMWEKIQEGFKTEPRKKSFSVRQIAAVAVLLLCFGALTMIQFSAQTVALGDKIISMFVSQTPDSVIIDTVVKDPVIQDSPKKISYEEALRILPRNFNIKKILPSGFKLTDIYLEHKLENTAFIMLEYTDGARVIEVREQNIIGDMASSESFNPDMKIEKVVIKGFTAIIARLDKVVLCSYTTRNMIYHIRGEITNEQVKKILESL